MYETRRSRSLEAALLGLVVLFAGASWAQPAGQGGQAQMSPAERAAMEAWMKAMTPGPEHQRLASYAGKWSGTVTLWQAPGAPPEVSRTSAERTMGLGGRVLIEHWTGTMMGMPFEGSGTIGYDKAAKQWWSTWSDNFGTGVMVSRGECAEDPAKGCTYRATSTDPVTGNEIASRSVVRWPGPDEETMEMYVPGPGGKEFKSMAVSIHRQK